MWTMFLKQWNGVSFFLDQQETDGEAMQFFTDATPSGFGGYFNGRWFCDKFEENMIPEECKASMALFELYPIVMSAVLWGEEWCKKRIIVNCDNESACEIINKGRSRIPFIMKFVRRLVWCEAKFNFTIRASYIPTGRNGIADSLSQFPDGEIQMFGTTGGQTGYSVPTSFRTNALLEQ